MLNNSNLLPKLPNYEPYYIYVYFTIHVVYQWASGTVLYTYLSVNSTLVMWWSTTLHLWNIMEFYMKITCVFITFDISLLLAYFETYRYHAQNSLKFVKSTYILRNNY
jgi:hypothetical protein